MRVGKKSGVSALDTLFANPSPKKTKTFVDNQL